MNHEQTSRVEWVSGKLGRSFNDKFLSLTKVFNIESQYFTNMECGPHIYHSAALTFLTIILTQQEEGRRQQQQRRRNTTRRLTVRARIAGELGRDNVNVTMSQCYMSQCLYRSNFTVHIGRQGDHE